MKYIFLCFFQGKKCVIILGSRLFPDCNLFIRTKYEL